MDRRIPGISLNLSSQGHGGGSRSAAFGGIAFIEEMNSLLCTLDGSQCAKVYQCDGAIKITAEIGKEVKGVNSACAVHCAVNNVDSRVLILHANRTVSYWQVRNPIPRQMDPGKPFDLLGIHAVPLTKLDNPKRHLVNQAALVSVHFLGDCVWLITTERGALIVAEVTEVSGVKVVAILDNHTDFITSALITPEFIISGSLDRKISVWDRNRYTLLSTCNEHKTSIVGMAYCETHRLLITASCEEDIKVMHVSSLASGNCCLSMKGSLRGHRTALRAVAEVSGCAISLDDSMEIKVWSLVTCTCIQSLHHSSTYPVHLLMPLSNSNRICAAGKRLYFYDIVPSSIEASVELRTTDINSENTTTKAKSPKQWKMPLVYKTQTKTRIGLKSKDFTTSPLHLLLRNPGRSSDREHLVFNYPELHEKVNNRNNPGLFGINIGDDDQQAQNDWINAMERRDTFMLESYLKERTTKRH